VRPQSSSSTQASQQLFSANCTGCHGLDGRGGEHGPNIATNRDVQRLDDRDILRILRDGVPGGGMPGFRSEFNDDQLNAVVRYVRLLQGKHATMIVRGDQKKGEALFFGKARCSECHMIGGKGGFIASDLSGYGQEHSPDVIREAIIDPNKNLEPRRQIVTAITRDGRKYTGIALNEDNFSLQLQTLDGAFHLFEKSGLAKVEHEPRSLMPSNYVSTLSPGDLDDLVAYLAAATTPGGSEPGRDEE